MYFTRLFFTINLNTHNSML